MFYRYDFDKAKTHWIWDAPGLIDAVVADLAGRGHPVEPLFTVSSSTQVMDYAVGGSIFLRLDKWVTIPLDEGVELQVLNKHLPALSRALENSPVREAITPYVKLHGAYFCTCFPATWLPQLKERVADALAEYLKED